MSTTRRPAPIRARWNADLSITLYSHHTKVAKFKGVDARRSVEDFCAGWFGTADQKEWRISWAFAESRKKPS